MTLRSTDVTAGINRCSLLLLGGIPRWGRCRGGDRPFPFPWTSGLFPVLGDDKTAISIHGWVFVWIQVFISLGSTYRNAAAGSDEKKCWTWSGSIQLFCKAAAPFCFPARSARTRVLVPPHSLLPTLAMASPLDFSHLIGCLVVSHDGFNLHFPND